MYCFNKNLTYTLEELLSDYTCRSRILMTENGLYDHIVVHTVYDCQPVDMAWLREKVYEWLFNIRVANRRRDWKFRDGPVPRTGGGGRKFRNWFTHPRTTQERRHEDEFTRGKRRNLPTAWDDQTRTDCRWNKPVSWKHNRKTQWK